MSGSLTKPTPSQQKEQKVPDFIQRGKVLIVRRQFQDAVKVCRLGLLAHPTFVEGRLILGMALMALARHDEVLAEMRVSLELEPDHPMAHLLKGEALFYKRDYEQAREVLVHAQRLDPQNAKVPKLLNVIGNYIQDGPAGTSREGTQTKVYPAQRGELSALSQDLSDLHNLLHITDAHELSEEWRSRDDNDEELPPLEDPEEPTSIDRIEHEEALSSVEGYSLSDDASEVDELDSNPSGEYSSIIALDEVEDDGTSSGDFSQIIEQFNQDLGSNEEFIEDDYTTAPFLPPKFERKFIIQEDGSKRPTGKSSAKMPTKQEVEGRMTFTPSESFPPDATPSPLKGQIATDGGEDIKRTNSSKLAHIDSQSTPPQSDVLFVAKAGQPSSEPGPRSYPSNQDDYNYYPEEEEEIMFNMDRPSPEALFGDGKEALVRNPNESTKRLDLDQAQGDLKQIAEKISVASDFSPEPTTARAEFAQEDSLDEGRFAVEHSEVHELSVADLVFSEIELDAESGDLMVGLHSEKEAIPEEVSPSIQDDVEEQETRVKFDAPQRKGNNFQDHLELNRGLKKLDNHCRLPFDGVPAEQGLSSQQNEDFIDEVADFDRVADGHFLESAISYQGSLPAHQTHLNQGSLDKFNGKRNLPSKETAFPAYTEMDDQRHPGAIYADDVSYQQDLEEEISKDVYEPQMGRAHPQMGRAHPQVEASDGMLEQMTRGMYYDERDSVSDSTDADEVQSWQSVMPKDQTTSWMSILMNKPKSYRLTYLLGSALLVILMAVGIGLVVRYYRLDEQVAAKKQEAQQRLLAGNLPDYIFAAQNYRDILSRTDDVYAQWAYDRLLVTIAFEFGESVHQIKLSENDNIGTNPDQAAAKVYANLFRGDLAKAAKLCLTAQRRFSKHALIHYVLGRIKLLEGNASAAVQYLKVAHRLETKNTLILKTLGDAFVAQSKTKAALNAYEQALSLNSQHIASLLSRSLLLIANRKRLQESIEDMNSILGKLEHLASSGQRGWAALGLARLLINRGEIAQAKRYVHKAKANMPAKDVAFYEYLADVLIDLFQLGEAEKAINQSKQIMAERPHPYYYMARIYRIQGKPKAALRELKQAKDLKHTASNLLRAQIHVELGHYKNASEEVDRILRITEHMLEAHIVKAKVLAAQGETTLAENKLDSLLVKHPENASLYVAQGELYLQMGRIAEAKKRFLIALKNDKHAFEAQIKLAEVYIAEGDFHAARQSLGEARRANYGNINILIRLAQLEFSMGDFAEAHTSYQNAIKRAPQEPQNRLNMAQVLIGLREFKEAKRQINAAQKYRASKVKLAKLKGQLALAQGDAIHAVNYLQEAVAGAAKDADSWDLLVRAHLMNNNERKARAAAARMASKLRKEPRTIMSMARVEINHGQAKRAIRRLIAAWQLLQQQSSTPPLLRAEFLVLLGRAYQDNGQLANAQDVFEEAVQSCRYCAEPVYRRALVLDERGKTDKAIQNLHATLKLNPRYAEVYYDLGLIYERGEQKSKAIKNYEKYLTFNPPKALANAAQEAIRMLK